MHPPIRSAPRRAVCVALLLTQLTACMTWRPVPGALQQRVGIERIPRARLRLRSGAELSLREVEVRADSVVGYGDDARERRAVPVADVSAIDRRQFSVARTAGVVVGAAAVSIVVIYGVLISQLANNIGAAPAPRVP